MQKMTEDIKNINNTEEIQEPWYDSLSSTLLLSPKMPSFFFISSHSTTETPVPHYFTSRTIYFAQLTNFPSLGLSIILLTEAVLIKTLNREISKWGRDFSTLHSTHTHLASYKMGNQGALSCGSSSQDMRLTIHLHLALMLRRQAAGICYI